MRVAVGSDEKTGLTDAVIADLEDRGITVELFGALAPGENPEWPEVGRTVGERVASGEVDHGVLFCWTGTGVCMAANKVPGVRAALCTDAETAVGARRWNHANVLAIGLRLTSTELAREMLASWFSTAPGRGSDADAVDRLNAMDDRYRRKGGE